MRDKGLFVLTGRTLLHWIIFLMLSYPAICLRYVFMTKAGKSTFVTYYNVNIPMYMLSTVICAAGFAVFWLKVLKNDLQEMTNVGSRAVLFWLIFILAFAAEGAVHVCVGISSMGLFANIANFCISEAADITAWFFIPLFAISESIYSSKSN